MRVAGLPGAALRVCRAAGRKTGGSIGGAARPRAACRVRSRRRANAVSINIRKNVTRARRISRANFRQFLELDFCEQLIFGLRSSRGAWVMIVLVRTVFLSRRQFL